MKLTKREKVMIITFIIMLVGYGYLRFLIMPNRHNLKALNEDIKAYEVEMKNTYNLIASQERLFQKYQELQENINNYTDKYLSFIEQDYLIILLNDIIESSNIQINSISFEEPKKEEAKHYFYETIEVSLPFQGDYETLVGFLKNVRQQEKTIVVKDLRVISNTNDLLEGNIVLEFYSLQGNINSEPNIKDRFFDGFYRANNPFSPFEGYIGDINEIENNNTNTNQGGYTDSTQALSPTEKLLTYTLENFEGDDSFFVGNPREVIGQIRRDSNSTVGDASLRLEYDFIRPRSSSKGNVVLEDKGNIIERQPNNIGLWIYAWEESNHKIGMILLDNNGREYDVIFSNQINWKGWKHLQVSLPIAISYPAKIHRIYIESRDYDEKTTGTILLDALKVVYREALEYNHW